MRPPGGPGRGGFGGGRRAPTVFRTVPIEREVTVAELLNHTPAVISGGMSGSVGGQLSADRA